jgi:hypothetical protein
MSKPASFQEANNYNAMVRRTTLRGLWLTESKFEMKPEALDPDSLAMRHDVRTSVVEVVIDENGLIYGFIQFSAFSRRKRQRVLQVSAKYFASYHVDGGCDQSSAHLFVERVGRLAAYPYFRALVASLVGQAGAQIPPLPVMSFQPRSVDYASEGEFTESKSP